MRPEPCAAPSLPCLLLPSPACLPLQPRWATPWQTSPTAACPTTCRRCVACSAGACCGTEPVSQRRTPTARLPSTHPQGTPSPPRVSPQGIPNLVSLPSPLPPGIPGEQQFVAEYCAARGLPRPTAVSAVSAPPRGCLRGRPPAAPRPASPTSCPSPASSHLPCASPLLASSAGRVAILYGSLPLPPGFNLSWRRSARRPGQRLLSPCGADGSRLGRAQPGPPRSRDCRRAGRRHPEQRPRRVPGLRLQQQRQWWRRHSGRSGRRSGPDERSGALSARAPAAGSASALHGAARLPCRCLGPCCACCACRVPAVPAVCCLLTCSCSILTHIPLLPLLPSHHVQRLC